MSTIVEAAVPAEQFALAETFTAVPTVEIDAVRLASTDADDDLPLVWARNADVATVADALAADDSTAEVSLVSRRQTDSLFRVGWAGRASAVTATLVEEAGTILTARGTSDGWTFRLLFGDRDSVSRTYEACRAADLDLDIVRIEPLEAASIGGSPLTDEQFRTLRTAFERGYYGVPRETTLVELAAQLDVSHQALSERLRRGHGTLVERALE